MKGKAPYEGLEQIAALPPTASFSSGSAGGVAIEPLAPPAPAPYLDSTNEKAALPGLPKAAQASLDGAVGFGGGAPQTAEMEKAVKNVGVSTVSGAWAFQGSRAAYKKGALINAQSNEVNVIDSVAHKLNWQASFRGRDVRAGDQIFSPPALGAQSMYLTSAFGHLISMDQKSGKVNFIYATSQPITFQPALAQGNIYTGTANGLLICVKTGNKDADGWSGWGGNAQHNKKD